MSSKPGLEFKILPGSSSEESTKDMILSKGILWYFKMLIYSSFIGYPTIKRPFTGFMVFPSGFIY